MAGVIKYLLTVSILLMCCGCSPIKRSTNQQDTDCYGTDCYYSDLDTHTELVLPENLTDVVLVNLPLISRNQDEIVSILDDKIVSLLNDKIVSILDNQTGSITTQIATQERIAALLSNQVASLNTHIENQNQIVSLLNNQMANQERTVNLLSSQVASLNTQAENQNQIANLLDNIAGSLNTMTAKHDRMENLLSHMTTMMVADSLRDCKDLAPYSSQSKTYKIMPFDASESYTVRCDLETDGGGWTVIQRRFDGSVDFYRDWQAYVDGFGDPDGEYWAGLELIHLLTKTGTWELRVDLEDFSHTTVYAHYASFKVGDATSNYRLSLGAYSGTGNDGMKFDNGNQFSTRDNDNDSSGRHCAETKKGAWWYRTCSLANLNGRYLGPDQIDGEGLTWFAWKQTNEVLKRSEMKIRPI